MALSETMLYGITFGLCLLWTVLYIGRQKTIMAALASFSWFGLAGAHLAVMPLGSVFSIAPTATYLGFGLLFFVLLFYGAFNDLSRIFEEKRLRKEDVSVL